MNDFLKRHKKEAIAFCLLLALTVVLCIPATLFPLVRIFGWVSYLYLAMGYFFVIFYGLKKDVRLRPANTIWLILSLVFIISTLQVVFCDKTAVDNMSRYISAAYAGPTVGGVVFGVFTAPVVVYCTYVWAIVIYLAFAALVTFLFFRPFIFDVGKNPVLTRTDRERPSETVVSEDAPVAKILRARKEPEPHSFNVVEPETSRDRARRLLLGGDYDMTGLSSEKDPFDEYINRSYVFGAQDDDSRRKAAVTLLSEDGSESTEDFDRMEKDLGIENTSSTKTLFEGNEELDLFSGGAKFRDDSFAAAVRQTTFQSDGPAPLEQPEEKPAFSYSQPAPSFVPPAPMSFSVEPAPVQQPAPAYQSAQPYGQQTYQAQPYAQQPSPYQQPVVQPVVTVTMQPVPSAQPVQPAQPAPQTQTYTAQSVQPTQPAPQPEVKKIDMTMPYMPAPPTREYIFPPRSLLKPHVNPKFVNYVENWDELKEVIEVKLQNYGVEAQLVDAVKGPTVTLVSIELGESCSVSKLYSASKDLRRLLKSNNDIAIIPQLPDTCYCGIEIPNKVRGTVSFQEVISSKEYSEAKGDIIIALGKTASGEIMIEDLAKMPHALIAGATGSGKSVCVNVIIASILCRYRPDEVKLILIDLKQVEMGNYSGLPHMLFKEPLYDMHQIVNALKWIRQETENRFSLFKSLHVRNLSEYNQLPGVHRLPRIVIIIDEASELMTKQEVRKTVESTLSSLARVARAAGVHLLFATQNPVKEVITNEIQNNLNTKIAFAVGDYNHSMVIFKAKGAECLLGYGDMYIKRGQQMQRGQCAFISTEESEDIVNFILENNEVNFDEEMIGRILNGSFTDDGEPSDFGEKEEREGNEIAPSRSSSSSGGKAASGLSDTEIKNWQALKICYDTNNVSCSYLQRRMSKGYNAVANILEYWEQEGFISKQDANKKRTLLRPASEFYALYHEKFGDDDPNVDSLDALAADVEAGGHDSGETEE